MKPSLSAFLSVLLLPAAGFAGDPIVVKKVAGAVEFKASKEAAWSQAQAGAQVPAGGQVRTGADGRAELKFKNKASVWLKPSTSVQLEQKDKHSNQLVLESGALKVRVPHLRFREKFQIKTPMAVASVRGTVFSMDAGGGQAGGKGGLQVNTYFGQVNVDFGDGHHVSIPQGMGYKEGGMSLLSQLDELAGLEDWTPGVADGGRRDGLIETVNLRQEIRDYANEALASHQEMVGTVVGDMKESDFAAGRTLTDVHGNLVRVEQRLDRPNASTVQVLNIVKRTTYSSGGFRHYAYHGPSGSRTDALIAKTEFNKALPDQINAFPGFFESNSDSVKVDKASLILANMGDSGDILTIAFLGQRNVGGGTDDIKSDLFVGTLTGSVGDPNKRDNLFGLTLTNAQPEGLVKYVEDTRVDSVHMDGANGELYGNGAKRFVVASNITSTNPADVLWLATESFVINNSGQIRNVSDFTSGGADFQDLLKNTAGEVAVFLKPQQGSIVDRHDLPNAAGEVAALNPNSKNIDLVVIPDLFYSIVKSLATSGDAFKTTY